MRKVSRQINNVCIANYTGALFHVGCQSASYMLENELKKRFGKHLQIDYMFSTTHAVGGDIPFSERGFSIVLDSLENNSFLLDKLKKADLLIINGEGTLHWPSNNNRVWYWLACIHIAKEKFGIPVWVINSSFFSGDQLFSRFSAKMLKKADHVALRDPVSYETVKAMGTKNVVNATDLTFLLPHRMNKDIAGYFEKKHPLWKRDNSKTRIILAGSSAISKASMSLWAENYLKILRGLKESLSNIDVLFVAQPDMGRDYDLFQALRSECEYINCFRETISPAEFIWIMKQANVAISGRFHVNTIAIVSNTPAVMLSGNTPKNEILAQMTHKQDYYYLNASDTEKILAMSKELCKKSNKRFDETHLPREKLFNLAKKNFPPSVLPNLQERRSVDLEELIIQTEFIKLSFQKRELVAKDDLIQQNKKLQDIIKSKDSIIETIDISKTHYISKYAIKLLYYFTHPSDGYNRLKQVINDKSFIFPLLQEIPAPNKKSFHDAEIKVLHVASTPLAGSPIRMCRLLDSGEYFSALSICRKNTYDDGRLFDYDIVYEPFQAKESDVELMRQLIKECDIIHFHNEAYHQRFGVFKEIPSSKPVCVQWHSGPDEIAHRLGISIREAMDFHNIPTFVVAQKQSRFYPNAIPVPNVVDIRLPEYQVVQRDIDTIHISYSPAGDAQSYERLCRDKGMNMILNALRIIKERYSERVSIHILQGIPLEKCIQMKQKCHITIDDIKSGGYHMVSLEGFAHASATIANPDTTMKEFLSNFTGCPVDELPWFEASEEDIVERLSELIENVDLIERIGQNSRRWMERYWNHEFIMGKMQSAYIEILNKS